MALAVGGVASLSDWATVGFWSAAGGAAGGGDDVGSVMGRSAVRGRKLYGQLISRSGMRIVPTEVLGFGEASLRTVPSNPIRRKPRFLRLARAPGRDVVARKQAERGAAR